jgi:hypothetical protein
VPPNVALTRAAAQSIPTGSVTAISFDTEVEDTDAMWSSGTNITINTAGLYLITAQLGFTINSTGTRRLYLRKNGTAFGTASIGAPDQTPAVPLSRVVRLAAADVITMAAYQNSGVALNTSNTTEFVPAIELVRLGA